MRPSEVPGLIRMENQKVTDRLYSRDGVEEPDVHFNLTRLDLKTDRDYLDLMSDTKKESDAWLEGKDARAVSQVKIMRDQRIVALDRAFEFWAGFIAR